MHIENDSCVCDSGYYYSADTSLCVECLSPCKTCLNSAFCLTCMENFYLADENNGICDVGCGEKMILNSENKCSCLNGTFKSFDDLGNAECVLCESPCRECKNLSFCLSCQDGFELVGGLNGVCEEIKKNETCEDTVDGLECENKCIDGVWIEKSGECKCMDGMFADKGLDGNFECRYCIEPCKFCLNSSFCKSCLDDLKVLDVESGLCLDRCEKGYYFSEGDCVKCKDLCDRCTNYELCTVCKRNSELIDNDCVCSRNSTLRNGKCVLKYFHFSISKVNMRIFITFNESLDLSISKSNINVKISNIKFSYNFLELSKKKYFLSITPKISIPKNTKLTFTIIKNPINSSAGSLLLNYTKSIYLSEYLIINTNQQLDSLIKSSKPIAQTATTSAIGISIVSNPASAWVLINTLQLIMYIPISQNKLTDNIKNFCTSLSDFNLLPNPMQYIFSRSSSSKPSKNQLTTGIDSSVFWYNCGQNVSLLIFFIILYPFIHFLSKLTYGKLALTFMKLLKNYKYGLFLRYWIESYLDLGFFSLIQLRAEIKDPDVGYFNLGSATVCMVIAKQILIVLTPPFLFISSYVSFSRLRDQEDADYQIKFGSLFYEFKNDKGFVSSQYYTIYFIRRLSYVLAHVYLDSMNYYKYAVLIVFTLAIIGFLLIYRPFIETSILLSALIGEVAALVGFCVSLCFVIGGFDDVSLEWCFVLTVICAMILQTVISGYQMCKGFVKVYQKLEKIRALQFLKSHQTLNNSIRPEINEISPSTIVENLSV